MSWLPLSRLWWIWGSAKCSSRLSDSNRTRNYSVRAKKTVNFAISWQNIEDRRHLAAPKHSWRVAGLDQSSKPVNRETQIGQFPTTTQLLPRAVQHARVLSSRTHISQTTNLILKCWAGNHQKRPNPDGTLEEIALNIKPRSIVADWRAIRRQIKPQRRVVPLVEEVGVLRGGTRRIQKNKIAGSACFPIRVVTIHGRRERGAAYPRPFGQGGKESPPQRVPQTWSSLRTQQKQSLGCWKQTQETSQRQQGAISKQYSQERLPRPAFKVQEGQKLSLRCICKAEIFGKSVENGKGHLWRGGWAFIRKLI